MCCSAVHNSVALSPTRRVKRQEYNRPCRRVINVKNRTVMETPGRRRLRLLVMSCATAAPIPPADNPVPLSSPGLRPAYSCCTLTTTTSRRRSLKKSYLNYGRNILAPVRVRTLTSSQYRMGRCPGEGRL